MLTFCNPMVQISCHFKQMEMYCCLESYLVKCYIINKRRDTSGVRHTKLTNPIHIPSITLNNMHWWHARSCSTVGWVHGVYRVTAQCCFLWQGHHEICAAVTSQGGIGICSRPHSRWEKGHTRKQTARTTVLMNEMNLWCSKQYLPTCQKCKKSPPILVLWITHLKGRKHYGEVIMGAIASQITSLTLVYSTVYLDADQRKHQSFASLAFVWGIHRGHSPYKWPVTRKMFPFDDVIMKHHDIGF